MTEIVHERISLTAGKIDEIAGMLVRLLEKNKYDRKEALRVRLLVEELLFAISGGMDSPGDCEITVSEKRGGCKISLVYDGLPFSPLEAEDEEYRALLLKNLGIHCQWQYKNHHNTISFSIKKRRGNSAAILLIAVAAAVLMSLLSQWIPENTSRALTENLFLPFRNAYLGLLNGIAGILVFFNIVSSLCGDNDSSLLSKKSHRMLVRMPVMALLISACGYLLLCLLVRIAPGAVSGNAGISFGQFFDLIWAVVPGNPIVSFTSGNLFQVLVIALVFGSALAAVRDRYPELVGVFSGMNHVVTAVTAGICRLCPAFVFCSLFMVIDTHGIYNTFRDLWKPIVLLISVGSVITVILLAVLRLRCKCGIIRFLKTISPAVLICLATGSPIASYGENVDILEKKLGVNAKMDLSHFG